MRERKFGRIINISSIDGQKGQFGQVNYSASKAGEIGFTKALAQEGARFGVTVNAICPGYIATDGQGYVTGGVKRKNLAANSDRSTRQTRRSCPLCGFYWPLTTG